MNIGDYKKEFQAVVDFLKNDIQGLRTGRATTAIVEDISVEAYGSRQPMRAVGTIQVADAKTVTIEPWDKSLFPAIEKGIRESSLGLNPVNDGRMIRLTLPELTSERRNELVKVLHQKSEHAKVSLRKVREDVRAQIGNAEKEKSIREDEKFKLQDELEKLVKQFGEEVQKIIDTKEKDITTV